VCSKVLVNLEGSKEFLFLPEHNEEISLLQCNKALFPLQELPSIGSHQPDLLIHQ
jgi:hypothetical protein